MSNPKTPLDWHTETRIVKDLIPYNYNPRKLSEAKKQKLIDSINKFNFVEIPVINLDDVLIAGHQRIAVMATLGRQDEQIDVRVPNRQLTPKELKEYNLRSNISIGEWVDEILEAEFSDIDFEAIGLEVSADLEALGEEQNEIEQFREEFEKPVEKPKYPLAPKYSEKHNAVIIICDNTMDATFLDTVLELTTHESYKSQRVGKTSVITVKKFQELWEKK